LKVTAAFPFCWLNQERHEGGADGRRKVVDRCMFEREAAGGESGFQGCQGGSREAGQKGSDDKQETPADDEAESEDNVLALVAVSRQLDLEAGRLEINDNVHGVLLALRNVKEQLLQSIVRRAGTFH
ncbi:hypothetical protein B296_00004103, partial [Ensete ventricosum]